jgi:hypothetical protein
MEAPLWTSPDELAERVVLLANLPTALLIPPPGRAEDPETTSRLLAHSLPRPQVVVLPESARSWERPDMTVREMYPAALRTRTLAEAVAS